MSLSFYFDHHAHHAVADGLRAVGVDVLTASEDGTEHLADDLLLERATQTDRVLYTQDRDFLAIVALWQSSGRDFSGVVYSHQLRITIGQAIRDLELIAKTCDASDMANHLEFLPL